MPRLFSRVISFKIEGELYDNDTQADDIIRNYTFNYKDYKDYNDGADKSYLVMDHKDHRGRITKMTRLPKINKWKKPDTEYYII